MMTSDTPEDTIRDALDAYFRAFAEGSDVPPAQRFYLEGYMQACVDGGLLNLAQVSQLILESCGRHLGDEVASIYQCADALVLHSHMKRAPVYPSC